MIIDPAVQKIAGKHFLDPKLVQAIVIAEGNILKAVQITFPYITTREQAIEILCNSIIHRLMGFINDSPNSVAQDYIQYLGNYWAPVGVSNDPNNLNKNWIPNVIKLWGKSNGS